MNKKRSLQDRAKIAVELPAPAYLMPNCVANTAYL